MDGVLVSGRCSILVGACFLCVLWCVGRLLDFNVAIGLCGTILDLSFTCFVREAYYWLLMRLGSEDFMANECRYVN